MLDKFKNWAVRSSFKLVVFLDNGLLPLLFGLRFLLLVSSCGPGLSARIERKNESGLKLAEYSDSGVFLTGEFGENPLISERLDGDPPLLYMFKFVITRVYIPTTLSLCDDLSKCIRVLSKLSKEWLL